MRRVLFAFTITLGTLASAPAARAQSAEAEALFNEGDKLFSANKIDEACEAFDASNRIEPRAGTMIRLGECREKQNRLASAWSAYRDALTRVKDPYKKQVATDRVAALEPKLSKLTVTVPHRIDGMTITRNGVALDAGLWNRAVPTDGGALVFVAKADGFKEWTTTITVPVAKGNVSVNVPRLEPLPATTTTAPAPVPVKATGEPLTDEPAAPGMTGTRKLAIGLGVVAVGAVVTGVVLGMSANGLEDDGYALCPDPSVPCADAAQAMDFLERGSSRATYANVAFGAGAALAIGATVLWFIGKPDAPARVSVTPRIDSTFAGAALEGRF